ncbi:MAG: hypothetical protein WCO10_02280 [bacterium]
MTHTPTTYDPAKSAVFAGDYKSFYLYKKTERLVAAIYLLSTYLSDNEPIKWEIRSLGVRLLSDSLSLATLSLADKNITHKNLVSSILKAVSILEIAYLGGLISIMNYEILKSEFEGVLAIADTSERVNSLRGLSLDKAFFAVPAEVPSSSEEKILKEESMSDRLASYANKNISHADSGLSHKGHYIMSDRMTYKNSPIAAKGVSVKQKDKTNRQDIIIGLLKKNHELGIKDFTGAISGCSEKTIQRELLSLVSKGLLVKKGDKRWSRYSLK